MISIDKRFFPNPKLSLYACSPSFTTFLYKPRCHKSSHTRRWHNSDEKFYRLIERALKDDLISKNEKEILDILRNLRNFIHIHLFIKSKEVITEKKFLGISQFFEDFLERFEVYFTKK